MKKITVKTPAKLNLTLDVLGVKENYHEIESLVASINLYDVITVKKRNDAKITLTMKGLSVDCPILENNAYKTAKLFIETFMTYGADIVVEKNIPVSGGLGGSSADIAGTLNALNKLYEVDGDLTSLAEKLGSDAPYMLKGGYAIMSGRGEKIESIDADRKLYILLITDSANISARNCYKKFDAKKKTYPPHTQGAKDAIYTGDLDELYSLMKNDLGASATELAPNIKHHLYALERVGAKKALVAGSGPTVYGVFKGKKERDNAYKKLVGLYGKDLIKAETVIKDNESYK